MSADLLKPKLVRRSFSAAAEQYESADFLQRDMGARLLERVAELDDQADDAWRAGTIVDLGSGPAFISASLRKQFPKSQVIALDAARGMLKQASKRFSWRRKFDRICADARALPLASQSVDLVLSNLMLQWIEQPEMVFQQLRRVMRPGAVLLFSTFGPETLRELRAAWAQVDDSPHVNRFVDMHQLGDALMQAGFRDPVMDRDIVQVEYDTVMGLQRDLKALGAHNVRADRRNSLTGKRRMQAMEEAYLDQFGPAPLPATYEVVFGYAIAPQAGQPRLEDGVQVASISPDALRRTRR